MREVRVFVSSPGDALHERQRVATVIERLSGVYRNGLKLTSIRWEVRDYSAHDTFQSQIPEAADCDVVIAIFRNRLGTPLPDSFPRMPDGDPYPSGAAYEVLSAIEARRRQERPDVFVFRYPIAPTIALDDAEAEATTRDQWARLKGFFERWFMTPDGLFQAAFQTYDNLDCLEQHIEQLLRRWVEENALGADAPAWPVELRGSPFRGLEAFGAKHAEVFFGRERDIERAVDKLKEVVINENGDPFLLLVGPSGSGKSSLARAGILSRVTTPGVVPQVDVWRCAVLRPSEVPGGVLLALSTRLFDDVTDLLEFDAGRPIALPELRDGAYPSPNALADLLGRGGPSAIAPIIHALGRIAAVEQSRFGSATPVRVRLLLVVDQLDDLLTGEGNATERDCFAELLGALAATGLVWIVATLRADLYQAYSAVPGLLALKGRGAVYDVEPLRAAALEDVVRRPAQAAGLDFDERLLPGGRSERLDERLIADAERPDMLPLVQFTLNRLFEERDLTRTRPTLSHKVYDRIGGLDGSIAHQAERALSQMEEDARKCLPRLLRQLVHATDQDGARRLAIRTVAYSDATYCAAAKQLVHGLIDARILLAEGGPTSRQVRLTHQRVLDAWPKARDAVAANARFFRIKPEVEHAEIRWRNNGSPANLLLPRGIALSEAEEICRAFGPELATSTRAYVRSSGVRARWMQWMATAAAIVFAMVAIAAGWQWSNAIEATAAAELSAKQAREAKNQADENARTAEEHRLLANDQRSKAEAARDIAQAMEARSLAQAIRTSRSASMSSKNKTEGLEAIARGQKLMATRLTGDDEIYRALLHELYEGAQWFRQLPVSTVVDGDNWRMVSGTVRFSPSGRFISIPTFSTTPFLLDAKSGLRMATYNAPDKVIHYMDLDASDRFLFLKSFTTSSVLDARSGTTIGYLCDTPTIVKPDPNDERRACTSTKSMQILSKQNLILTVHESSIRLKRIGTWQDAVSYAVPIGGRIIDASASGSGSSIAIVIERPASGDIQAALHLLVLNSNDGWSSFKEKTQILRADWVHNSAVGDRTKTGTRQRPPYIASVSAKFVAVRHSDNLTLFDANDLLVVHEATRVSSTTPRVGGAAEVLAWSSDGSRISVFDEPTGTTEELDTSSCALADGHFSVHSSRLYVWTTVGQVCVVDRKSKAVLGNWRNPDGQIRSLVISPDEKRVVIEGHDDVVSVWPAETMLAAVRPVSIPASFVHQRGWADPDIDGAYSLEVDSRTLVRLTLESAEQVQFVVDEKRGRIYGRDQDGYLFITKLPKPTTELLAVPTPPDLSARFPKHWLTHFTSREDELLVQVPNGCVSLWRVIDKLWRPGKCLEGAENVVEIRPVLGSHLIVGRDRTGNALVWKPTEDVERSLPIALAVGLEANPNRGGFFLQRDDLLESAWKLISSTEDAEFLAIGSSAGSIRIVRLSDAQNVAMIDLALPCDKRVKTGPLPGDRACLAHVEFQSDEVHLVRAISPGYDGSHVALSDTHEAYAWFPNSEVWRAKTKDLLAYLAPLDVAAATPHVKAATFEDWCTQAAARLDASGPMEVGVATFVARAFSKFVSDLADPAEVSHTIEKCPPNVRALWPSWLAVDLRALESVDVDMTLSPFGMFSRASALAKASASSSYPYLSYAVDMGILAADTLRQLRHRGVSICELERIAEAGDPLTQVLLSQIFSGTKGLRRDVHFPLPQRSIDATIGGGYVEPERALALAQATLRGIGGFRSDAILHDLSSTVFGLTKSIPVSSGVRLESLAQWRSSACR